MLADHHTQSLWALKSYLEDKPEFLIAGEVTDAQTLLDMVKSQRESGQEIDLVLVDSELPGRPITDLILDLLSLELRPKVVVMSSNPEHSRKVLQAGADVFVSKGDQPDWMLESLLRIVEHRRSAKPNEGGY